MRRAASISQVLQLRVGPRGARTTRAREAPGISSFGLMALPTNVPPLRAEATVRDERLDGVDVGCRGAIGDALRDHAANFRMGAFHAAPGAKRTLILQGFGRAEQL